jgi:Spy/CpxP family protein refolding chaperone
MTIHIARSVSFIVGMVLLVPVAIQATQMDFANAQAPVAAPKQAAGATSLIEQLKLTSAQKQKIATFRKNRTIEMNKVLTSDQKAKFEAARKAGKSTSETMNALGLKPAQKKKIADIAKNSAGDIMSVLNPQQKKQVITYLKQQRGGLE